MAEARGIVVELEAAEETVEYVSSIWVSAKMTDRIVSVAGTIGRKGPMLVEILGYDVELPFSPNVLVVRNADTPGMIGRVGSYLGNLGVNIANMVVGRSKITGEAAMMGVNLDQALSDAQVDGLRALEGVRRGPVPRPGLKGRLGGLRSRAGPGHPTGIADVVAWRRSTTTASTAQPAASP